METIWKMIEQYRILLNDIYVDPKIFLFFTTILICVFVLRFLFLVKIEMDKVERDHKLKKQFGDRVVWLGGHILLEILLGFLTGYTIIKLTLANPESLIINYIIAPASGLLIGIVLDNIIIEKLEGGNVDRIGMLLSKNKKSKKDKDDESKGNGNNITINVNSNGTNTEDNTKKNNINPVDNIMDNTADKDVFKHIDKDDTEDDEELIDTIIESINDLKDLQKEQNKQINLNNKTLNTVAEIMNSMRESSMNDKKVSLKKMIYECLDQGYATPQQNETITTHYSSYTLLNGNGEIKRLYEDHYLRLGVHEDRRKNRDNDYHGIEKRANKSNCEYGKYDQEINEQIRLEHEKDNQ